MICKMPRFALQNAAFYSTKDGILQRKMPSFGKRFAAYPKTAANRWVFQPWLQLIWVEASAYFNFGLSSSGESLVNMFTAGASVSKKLVMVCLSSVIEGLKLSLCI